jgi:hypothetical protein
MAKNILKNDIRIIFDGNVMFTNSNIPGNVFSGNLKKLKQIIAYFEGHPENGKLPAITKMTVYNNSILMELLQEGILPEERNSLKLRDDCPIIDDIELYYALK